MKAIFVDPPMMSGSQFKNYPNVGLLYIISNIRKHLPDVEVGYIPGRLEYEESIEQIKQEAPDFLGSSMSSFFKTIGYKLLTDVRRALPNTIIYAGGPMPSASPKRSAGRERHRHHLHA